VAFNGDVVRERAAQFLARLPRSKGRQAPLLMAHRLMGALLLLTGAIHEGRAHCERAIALYDPVAHRPLATRFGQDARVHALLYRSWATWLFGHPDAALEDADDALADAREIGQAAILMTALALTSFSHTFCGNYAAANAKVDELIALAEEKGAPYWRGIGTWVRGCLLALIGKPSDAVRVITSGIEGLRSTGATLYAPWQLSSLAAAHAELGHCDEAWRCIGEARTAVATTKETWFEAEVNRMAGEIALMPPEPDPVKAEAYFEHALAVARQQLAKSWELRATMSMGRLWGDQGKRKDARDLLAPVYR
jgi:predicted ATPase